MAEAEAGLELPIGLTEQKFLQALARIEARSIKTAQRAERGFVKSNQQISKSFGGMSRQTTAQLQNVSYQLQDIFVQISSGQGVARALGQQLPQLASGFGLVGSAIGLVAGLSIPLAASLFSTGEEAKKLSDAIKDLAESVDDYNAAVERAGTPTADLVQKYGQAAGAAQQLLTQLAQISKIEAAQSLRENGNAIADVFDGLIERVAQYNEVAGTDLGGNLSTSLENARGRLEGLTSQFGLSIEQAQELASILSDQASAQNVEGQADAMRRLADFLTNAAEEANYANSALTEVAKAASEGALSGYELQAALDAAAVAAGGVVDTVDLLPGSIDAATQSALNLTRALSAAIQAAQSMPGAIVPDLNRFGNGEDITRRAGGADLQEQQDFRYKWLAQLEEAERAARSGGSSRRRSGGRKSSGGSGGSGRQETPFFGDIERDLVNLERQIELIGKSSEEVATLKARWELLDEAKKRGLNVDEALNAQIDAQSAKVGQLTAELERAEIAQEQFEAAVDGIADAMAGALVAGESLREGLAQVFKQIASDILSSGIRQALQSSFAPTGGGGGGFGNIIGSLFGGFRANGGPVDAGKAYVVGERGPEIVVPGRNSTVIPNHALDGGSGGTVDVRVYMDDNGNWQAQAEQISGRVAVRMMQADKRAMADQRYLRGNN